jgi:hypothetical protein
MNTSAVKPTTIRIHINKEHFDVEVPISGAQLRDLGRIPVDNQLFEERHGQDPDVLIESSQSYTPKAGTHYYDLPKGTVGNVSVDEQLGYAVRKLRGASFDPQADGTVVLRWKTRLPEAWEPRAVDLLVVVPPEYPGQAPSGFDVVAPISQSGAAPPGTGPRNFAGLELIHFCWNAAGAIDYASPDGLWRFAKFAEKRFLA